MEKISIRRGVKFSNADRIYLTVVYLFMGLFSLSILYPLLYVVSASFSSPTALITGRVFLLPVEPGLQGYKAVLGDPQVWRGYANTILYTAAGTILGLFITMLGGYVLSRKEFPLKNPVMMFFTITMFFSGGTIPSYLLIANLGLLNTIWALILPGAFSVWWGIIARTYIQTSIPEELYEAMSLDGGNYFDHFFRIVLPLSSPVLAVMALGFATWHWNSYYSAMLYLNETAKFPLQLILRSILIQNSVSMAGGAGLNMDVNSMLEKQYLSELLKYSLIIVSSFPLLVIYPFIQKFFIKGIMVGSLKG